MKKMLNKLKMEEKGQAFILALILLAVGGLIIIPLLGFMGTGLMAARLIENKVDGTYAADAGVEDALWKIVNGGFDSLNLGDDSTYLLTNMVNGENVSVTVTKMAIVESFIGDENYQEDQPHEDWITLTEPVEIDSSVTEDWVEYSVDIAFFYDGNPWRRIDTIAAIFGYTPTPNDLVNAPFDSQYTGQITDTTLDADSPETKFSASSFGFIWRWNPPADNQPSFRGPDETDGSLGFSFRVDDASWEPTYFFIWALVGSADVSYITNAPGLFNWEIESTAGDTTVRSYILAGVLDGSSEVQVLTWEINP
jgi:hypothetical protein